METWQIILIYTGGVVASGIAGSVFAVFAFYLSGRLVFKYRVDLASLFRILFSLTTISNKTRVAYLRIIEEFRRPKSIDQQVAPEPMVEEQFIPLPMVEKPQAPVQILLEPSPLIVEEDKNIREIVPDLLIEFEHSLEIARGYSGSNLLSLQTNIWDTSQHTINILPVRLKAELASLYATIKILNTLVWFSSEFQRHSNSLDEQYSSLLDVIVRKINELTTLLSPYFKEVPAGSDSSEVPVT